MRANADRERGSDVAGRGGRITRIGAIIRGYLGRHELDRRARQAQVSLSWAEIVGEVIARVSCVDRVADGVAYVHCVTPVWAQTLSFRRTQILAKIAERLGSNVISDVRFNSLPGIRPTATPVPARQPPGTQRPASLTPQQEETIAAIAASLERKLTQQM